MTGDRSVDNERARRHAPGGGASSLSGGELNAAVTSEVVRVHSAYLGRGPTKSFSFHSGVVVLTVMQATMTRAEQSLARGGDGDAVLAMRQAFQRTMRDDLTASVEALTGRNVTAFMSANHLDPDMAVEVFVLDAPLN